MPQASSFYSRHTLSHAVFPASDAVRHLHIWSHFAPFLPLKTLGKQRVAHRGKEEEKEGIWKYSIKKIIPHFSA